MKLPTTKRLQTLGLFLIAILFSAAAYLQIVQGLPPCPLCQLQRVFLGLVGLTLFLARVHRCGPAAAVGYGTLILFFASIGAGLASRQIWLQFHPLAEGASCIGDLSYLFKVAPISEALKLTLKGTPSCSEVSWHFLGLSLPAWSLLGFFLLGYIGALQIVRAYRES